MLETLQTINAWVWNILGIIIGLPLVLTIGCSALITLIAGIFALFTRGFKK